MVHYKFIFNIVLPLRRCCKFAFPVTAPTAIGTGKPGLYVVAATLEVINVRSKRECFLKCLQHQHCVSVNFLKAAHRSNDLCVLNLDTESEYDATLGTPGESYYGADVSRWPYLELRD